MTKFSESYPIKEQGTNSSVESILDPVATDMDNYIINITGEGVYYYDQKQLVVDGVTKTYYQQFIRSEVIGAISNFCNGVALDSNNYAWCWGRNTEGQCGDGTITNRSSPVSVLGGRRFISTKMSLETAAGASMHGLADDGTIWFWGYGYNGQGGDGTSDNRSSPVSILSERTFVAMANATLSSFAIDHLGYAWAWGFNGSGGLGDNSITNRFSPVSVVGAYRFCSIGGRCGIDFNNNVMAWGDNTYGQVGDNTVNDRSSPVSVLGMSNVIKIATGLNQKSYLKNDGTIWSCGRNDYGQLGDGTTNNRSSPVSVLSNRRFVDIVAGSNHALALDIDGFMWCWGDNQYGQLGIGNVEAQSTPVSAGTQRFLAVGTWYDQSIAMDTNGILWAWGLGSYGQLGIGNDENRSRPTSVLGNRTWKIRRAD